MSRLRSSACRIFEPLHQMGDILTGKPDGLGLSLHVPRSSIVVHSV